MKGDASLTVANFYKHCTTLVDLAERSLTIQNKDITCIIVLLSRVYWYYC